MKQYSIIRMEQFQGGLHLSRGLTNSYDKSLKTLHSDTIKSAIFVCALQLFGETEIDQTFLEGFRISSAFPFYKSQARAEPFYFLPKPELVRLPFTSVRTSPGIEKKLKGVRFLETTLFSKVIKGEGALSSSDGHIYKSFAADFDLETMFYNDACDDIMKSSAFQHVQVSRDHSSDSVPYYVDKIFFHKHAGLYFLIEYENKQIEQKVKSALYLLADSGIGTDRNNGNGHFSIAESQLEIDVPDSTKANYQIALSLYCPEHQEIEGDLPESYYSLVKRGGYISSPKNSLFQSFRKKSIYMFTEGSLFPRKEKRNGIIVDLKPNDSVGHPIYRDGRSIFLPFKMEKNDV